MILQLRTVTDGVQVMFSNTSFSPMVGGAGRSRVQFTVERMPGLVPLAETDDLHRRAALGTADWVRCVSRFDQRRPALADLSRHG